MGIKCYQVPFLSEQWISSTTIILLTKTTKLISSSLLHYNNILVYFYIPGFNSIIHLNKIRYQFSLLFLRIFPRLQNIFDIGITCKLDFYTSATGRLASRSTNYTHTYTHTHILTYRIVCIHTHTHTQTDISFLPFLLRLFTTNTDGLTTNQRYWQNLLFV